MYLAGHRGPAEDRWRSPSRAADHDVLRRRPFQEYGVDDRVADQRCEGQDRRQRVDDEPQHQHRRRTQDERESQRLDIGQPALRHRPVVRPGHLDVDAGVQHVIDDRGRRRGQADAERADHQRNDARPAGHGQHHAHDRREHDQHDDLRLGQLVEVAPYRAL